MVATDRSEHQHFRDPKNREFHAVQPVYGTVQPHEISVMAYAQDIPGR